MAKNGTSVLYARICKIRPKKNTNIISTVIRGDESWVYGYDADSQVSQRLELNQWLCWIAS